MNASKKEKHPPSFILATSPFILSPMAKFDAVFVGSGISSLVGAAIMCKAGWEVCVLERNRLLGGNICTEELTVPGFRHDVLSGWHPLFLGSSGYVELASDLQPRPERASLLAGRRPSLSEDRHRARFGWNRPCFRCRPSSRSRTTPCRGGDCGGPADGHRLQPRPAGKLDSLDLAPRTSPPPDRRRPGGNCVSGRMDRRHRTGLCQTHSESSPEIYSKLAGCRLGTSHPFSS